MIQITLKTYTFKLLQIILTTNYVLPMFRKSNHSMPTSDLHSQSIVTYKNTQLINIHQSPP